MRFTGASVPRREDPRLLAGAGRFVDDIDQPDLLDAVFVRSPVAHGRLVSIDADDALATDGVVAVLTAEDLAQCCSPMGWGATGPLIVPAHLPLADDRVRFAGDPIAVVIAHQPGRRRRRRRCGGGRYRAAAPGNQCRRDGR